MSEQKNIDGGWAFVGAFFLILLFIFFNWLSKEHIYIWYYLKWPLVKIFYYIPESVKPYLFFWIEYFDYFRVNDINLFFKNLNELFDKGVSHIYQLNIDGEFNATVISRILSYMYLPYIAPFLLYYSIKSLNSKSFFGNFDMSSFRNQESELWPTIKPAISVSEKEINNLSQGSWAMSLRPESFFWDESRRNHFFEFLDEDNNEYIIKKTDKSFFSLQEKNIKFKMKYDSFYNLLDENMGEPWTGIDSLSDFELDIFCIFISKASRQTELSLKYINLCSNYYNNLKGLKNKKERKESKKKIDVLKKDILEKYLKNEFVEKTINKHYYKYTVFAGLLEKAREDGVLANSDFLWLKPKNRDLWYILSSVGRNLPFPNVAGIWSHYIYEKRVGFALAIPKIKNGVDGFDTYFYDRFDNYISYNHKKEKDDEDDDDDY